MEKEPIDIQMQIYGMTEDFRPITTIENVYEKATGKKLHEILDGKQTGTTSDDSGKLLTGGATAGTFGASLDPTTFKGEKGDKGDTGAQGIQGLQGFTGATGATGAKGDKGDKGDTGAAADLSTISPIYRYFTTANAKGFIIETDIKPTATGFVECKLTGNTYTSYKEIDTIISFYHSATGAVTTSTMTMLNNGIRLGGFKVYLNAGGCFEIYVPCSYRYIALFAEVVNGGAGTALELTAKLNRAVNLTQVTANVTTGTSFVSCPDAGILNLGGVQDRTAAIYVATRDGDDNSDGTSRANSLKTVAKALKMVQNSNNMTLYINGTVAAMPTAYASSTAYVAGDRVSYGGFIYERVTDGTGTTPSITATVWKPVCEDGTDTHPGCTYKGDFAENTAYAVGNIVRFKGTAANSNYMTYICGVAISGNYGDHTKPTGTLLPNRCWIPLGKYQAAIPTSTISHFKGLTLAQTDAMDIAVYGNLTLSRNDEIECSARLRVGGSFVLDYVSNAYISGVTSANLITASYSGVIRFGTTTDAFAYMSFTDSNILFYGVTTIKGEVPTRTLITANHSNVDFYSTLTLTGTCTGNSSTTLAADNTGIGISATVGGKVRFLSLTGAVTITGNGTAMSVATGGVVEAKNRTLSLLKGANTVATDTIAIKLDASSMFVRSRNLTALTRTNCADSLDANATVLDYIKLYNAGLLGFNA